MPITDERLFSLIALLCLLFWLLARSGRLNRRSSRYLSLAATLLLAVGLGAALLMAMFSWSDR